MTVAERSAGPGSTPHAALQRRYSISVVSEDLSGAPDEGTKKFTLAVAAALGQSHDVTLVSTQGRGAEPTALLAPASRTFLSRALRHQLRGLRPELIVYVARPSTTFWSFLRARVLKLYCPDATVVLLGLQTRRHSAWQRRLLKYLSPDLVCVQATDSQQYLSRLGCRTASLPSGVDIQTFAPVSADRRRELHRIYGLDPTRPVILHVGHLKPGRGIHVLADLARHSTCQVVLITSTSTAHEAEAGLADVLREAGVIVRTEFQHNIEHFYQLAACYVFPVESQVNAIEVPLSVLEALACDLPVVTTRFGGLPRILAEGVNDGLVYVHSRDALVTETLRATTAGPFSTRPLILPHSWEAVATRLLTQAFNGELST